jgi:hypothetical protein
MLSPSDVRDGYNTIPLPPINANFGATKSLFFKPYRRQTRGHDQAPFSGEGANHLARSPFLF